MIPSATLTSRELASAFWLTVLGLVVVAIAERIRDVRASLSQLRRLRLPLETGMLPTRGRDSVRGKRY